MLNGTFLLVPENSIDYEVCMKLLLNYHLLNKKRWVISVRLYKGSMIKCLLKNIHLNKKFSFFEKSYETTESNKSKIV